LEIRSSRGDLIEAYKIIIGKDAQELESFFDIRSKQSNYGTPVYIRLLKQPIGTLDQKFFNARVVYLWNGLNDSRLTSQ
jgi:hypothetical protein